MTPLPAVECWISKTSPTTTIFRICRRSNNNRKNLLAATQSSNIHLPKSAPICGFQSANGIPKVLLEGSVEVSSQIQLQLLQPTYYRKLRNASPAQDLWIQTI